MPLLCCVHVDFDANPAAVETQIDDTAFCNEVAGVTDSEDALTPQAAENRPEAQVFGGTDEQYLATVGFPHLHDLANGQGARFHNLANRHAFEEIAERIAAEHANADRLMRPLKGV